MTPAGQRILIRADASRTMGTGHVMRCLTLANALRQQGHTIRFTCVPAPGDCIATIEAAGFPVLPLHTVDDPGELLAAMNPSERWDWLIVDHYGLDARWEKSMRTAARHIAVIDDLANRPHDGDLLLDQNLNHTEADYRPLTPPQCRLLIGPQYALLREEFQTARNTERPVGAGIRQLLVNFGGSDPTCETAKTLQALSQLPESLRPENILVVVGGSFEGLDALRQQYRWPGLRFRQNITDMAQVFEQSDLVIGGGGTTSWERCCLGVPSLIIAVADNQLGISHSLADHGAAEFLGMHTSVTSETIRNAIEPLLRNPERLQTMHHQAAALVDGLGVDRVTAAMAMIASPAPSGSRP